MTHRQFVMCDVFAGGLLQIGDQVGEKEILQFAAGLTDQMSVRHGIFVIAVGLSGNGEPTDLPVGGQLIEVAVDRAHGDVRHLFPGPEEDFLRGQVVVNLCKNVADQRLLFCHVVTAFCNENYSCF